MESENGVAVEDEKHVIGETTEENINKEAENGCNAEIQTTNEVSEAIEKVEGPKSAASKNSKPAKEPGGKGGVASKNNKSATKDKPNLKSTTSSPQTHRTNLSKSLSFPAKSAGGDGMKKSLNGTLVKTETKHANGARVEASIRLSSRLTNSKVNLKEAKTNTGNSNQRTSLTSMTSLKSSKSGMSTDTPANAVAKSITSEASLPVDQISSPAKTEKPNKEDDDAHSTTSSHSPRRRSSGSGFSFRLEERAEKRKEFFSKLEEKIQEKEAEKTNQQEKSKENQEAEIKQLRKTMTFKATPMPSFYKEPPPKVELKKIPTTRPKSPKLGRHKGSAVNNSDDKSCSSPHGKQQRNESTKAKVKGNKEVISKKPIRKTQAKLQSQETEIRKTEKDCVRSTKINQDAKTGTGNNEECHDPPVNNSEYQNDMELESKNELAQNVALVLNSSTPDIVYEVTVGV
ncbi:WAVE-DAMPENED 2 [Spatholobus suberectus]|nr:WAVE-DAMPENED 2 [Spatholobus suberectus]